MPAVQASITAWFAPPLAQAPAPAATQRKRQPCDDNDDDDDVVKRPRVDAPNLVPGGVPCVFAPGVRVDEEPRLIIAGLYPPPGGVAERQHDNRTSHELVKVMNNTRFDWVDLFPFAPPGHATCGAMNAQGMLANMEDFISGRTTEARSVVEDYRCRLLQAVERERAAGNCFPVIVWAGQIVNHARVWLEELDDQSSSSSSSSSSSFQTPWFVVRVHKDRYVSVEDAVHPSAHLQAGGEACATSLFKTTYLAANLLRGLQRQPTFEDLYNAIDVRFVDVMVAALDELGVPHTNGWLELPLRHLRHVTWNDSGVVDSIKALKAALSSQGAFLETLRKTPASCLLNAGCMRMYTSLASTLGNAKFVTFITGSVACRLADTQFTDLLEVWRGVLGNAKFVTFISDSVACRLADTQFTDLLEVWRGVLGNAKFVTFITGSVACRLADTQFTDLLEVWRGVLGNAKFVTFITGSVASRRTETQFTDLLEVWRGVLGNAKFVTFISNSVARRLADTQFTDLLEVWRLLLGDAKFVAVAGRTGIACRAQALGVPFAEFVRDASPPWTQKMSHELCRRVDKDAKHVVPKVWLDVHTFLKRNSRK